MSRRPDVALRVALKARRCIERDVGVWKRPAETQRTPGTLQLRSNAVGTYVHPQTSG